MKKKIVAMALLAVMLTGCGTAGSGSATVQTSQGTTSQETAGGSSGAAASNTGTKVEGGNIIIAETADPQNVNPLYVVDQTSFDMMQALYSPFFELVNGEVYYENGLCESITPNEDATEFVLKLKDNLKWHDGEPITADDVVFTMNVVVDPDQNVPYSSYAYVGDQAAITEKVDELTVKITLAQPTAGFLGGLSQIYCIPEHIYEGVSDIGSSALNMQPVGSGPFKFTGYKSGEYFKVERFDDWFDEVNLDSITFKIVKDANSANAALTSGDINARLISTEDYATVSGYDNVSVYSYNSGRVNALFMNQNQEDLKDVKVRQAIAYALNKEELTQFAFTSLDFAQPAYSIFTPETMYYTENLEKYDNDVEKAKKLLAEAGKSDLKLNIMYISTNKTMESEALYIQSKLAEVGITIELKPMDEATFKNKIKETDTMDYDLVLSFYTLGEEPSLYADMSSTGSRSNYSRIEDTTLDDLWSKGNTTVDETERAAVYEKIQNTINDNMYIYPISYSKGFYAVDNRYKGFEDCLLKTIYYDYSKIYQTAE